MKKIIKNPLRTIPALITLLTGLLIFIFLACPSLSESIGSLRYVQSGFGSIYFQYNSLVTASSAMVVILIVLGAICIISGFLGYLINEDFISSRGLKFVNIILYTAIVSAVVIFEVLYWVLLATGISGSQITLSWAPMVATIITACACVGLGVYLVLYILELRAKRKKEMAESKEATEAINKQFEEGLKSKTERKIN